MRSSLLSRPSANSKRKRTTDGRAACTRAAATIEAWCSDCYGRTPHSPASLTCCTCGAPIHAMRRTLSDRYSLTWADPMATGRRSIPLGVESFTPGAVADLLTRAEQLLAHGHSVTIRPPASRVIDATPIPAASQLVTVTAL